MATSPYDWPRVDKKPEPTYHDLSKAIFWAKELNDAEIAEGYWNITRILAYESMDNERRMQLTRRLFALMCEIDERELPL